MSVIEFAEKRLDEEAHEPNGGDCRYWVAYLDGALAQARENAEKEGDADEVMMKTKVIYLMEASDLICLCTKNGWFTLGNKEQYDELFNMIIDRSGHNGPLTLTQDTMPDTLLKMALLIQQYSTEDSLPIKSNQLGWIMHCLGEICHPFFFIDQEDYIKTEKGDTRVYEDRRT